MVFFVHGEDHVVEALSKHVQAEFDNKKINVKVVVDNAESKTIESVANTTTPFNVEQLVGRYRFLINRVDKDNVIAIIRIPSQIAMMRILKVIMGKDLDREIKQKQVGLIQDHLSSIDFKTNYIPYSIIFESKDLKGEPMDLIKAYDNGVFKRNKRHIAVVRMLDLYKGPREVGLKEGLSEARLKWLARNFVFKYLYLVNKDELLSKKKQRIMKKKFDKNKRKFKKQGGKKDGNGKTKKQQPNGKGNFSKANRPRPKGNSSRGPATGNSRGNRNQTRSKSPNTRSNGISRNKSKGVNKK